MKIIIRAPANLRQILVNLLFYFAAGCLFASLMNAPGQIYLGKLYYIKDLGVILSFFVLAGMAALRNDKLAMLLAAAAAALMFPFVTALPKDDTITTGLTIMWIMKFAVAAQLGILTYRERITRALAICVGILLTIVFIDGVIGLWEIRSHGYFFEASAENETAAGVDIVGEQAFGELIRIHGIHRSPGDFGNSMAMGMILCAFLALACRRKAVTLVVTPLFLLLAYDVFFSTLRSFLVGSAAGVMAVLAAMLLGRWLGRYLVHLIAVLIVACLFFSYFNIIPMVEFVSKHILSGYEIGNVESSYMRLDSWDIVFADIRASPIVMLIGGPLASALSVNTPPANICDNIYLWIFYHLGGFGLLGFVVCVPLPLATRTDRSVRALYFAAATQVLVTGIFTDSLFYFSSLILFYPLGLILAELRERRARSLAPLMTAGSEAMAASATNGTQPEGIISPGAREALAGKFELDPVNRQKTDL